MTLWVGDNGRKQVQQPYVGDGTQIQTLEELWVGDISQTPRLVWLKIVPLNLSGFAVDQTTVTLNWTEPANSVTSYRVSSSAGTGVLLYGSHTSYTFNNVVAGSTATYKVEAFRDGSLIAVEQVSVTTPPPPIQQKIATLSPIASGTYEGNGSLRTDTSNLYSGYYSSNRGYQRSAVVWNIPADVRGCVSVDKIEISLLNLHTWAGTGIPQQNVAVWTRQDIPSTLGSYITGAFGGWGVAKGGWLDGQEWVDVSNLGAPSRPPLKEEFRSVGISGMSLIAADPASQSYYGYYSSNFRLRLTYTVNT